MGFEEKKALAEKVAVQVGWSVFSVMCEIDEVSELFEEIKKSGYNINTNIDERFLVERIRMKNILGM